jgi:hypothetical protein
VLRNLTQLYGDKLGALDGEVGHVKDFYFDDQSWTVRYVVADTETWLPGRQVLLSPYAFGRLRQAGKLLLVNLSRNQIDSSPSIETHKPVSRQYEEEYHRYYGWPFYWQGGSLWGRSDFPTLELTVVPPQSEPTAGSASPPAPPDAHLRSTRAVAGYHLQASDGVMGHVCDYLVDPHTWEIRQLLIKIGHRFSGQEVQIPTSQIERISYDQSTVFVRMTKAEVERDPAVRLALATGADSRLL